jgi:hypothetical protein
MIGRHESEEAYALEQKRVARITNLRKELRKANKSIQDRDRRIERLEAKVKAEKESKEFWYAEHNHEAARRRNAEHPVIKALREGRPDGD